MINQGPMNIYVREAFISLLNRKYQIYEFIQAFYFFVDFDENILLHNDCFNNNVNKNHFIQTENNIINEVVFVGVLLVEFVGFELNHLEFVDEVQQFHHNPLS